jgi:hypothetical protein
MSKEEFETKIESWITSFIASDNDLTLIKIFKKTNLSKISHHILNGMPISKICDFICDVTVLVKHKDIGFQLIFINRFIKSIGIKDIGEMLVYSKLAKPYYAFLISINGHSTEINNIVVNEGMAKKLFEYDLDKTIILFALQNEINKDSVLPINIRKTFYQKI